MRKTFSGSMKFRGILSCFLYLSLASNKAGHEPLSLTRTYVPSVTQDNIKMTYCRYDITFFGLGWKDACR